MNIYVLDGDTISDLKKTITEVSGQVAVLEYSPDGSHLGVGMSVKDVYAFSTTDYKVLDEFIVMCEEL